MFLLLTGLIMLCCQQINAAHIIGGEMSYRCFGAGKYQLTVKLYRDCYGGGANFDSFTPQDLIGQITIYQGSSSVPFQSVLLDAPKVVNIVPDLSDECRAQPPDLCVEEGVYTILLDLPRSRDSYFISYQRCCRNNTISNIHNPGETGATYSLEISPLAQESCNNSPVFKEFPPVAICANEPLSFDHSAIDEEGDSLVYEFCAPLKGGSLDELAPDPDANVPFEEVDFVAPNYTADQPLAGDPLVKIDPVTGMITGTPTTVGQFVVGICVKEYRGGELLSITQRDFQFNVVPCNFSVVADLDGGDKEGDVFLYEICQGDELEINNTSYSQDNIHAYEWNFNTGDSTFNSADPHVVLTFPEEGDYKGQMVINPSEACTDTALVRVLVKSNPSAEITYSFDTCDTGPVQFHLFLPINESPIVNYHWNFGDGNESTEILPMHQFAEGGSYNVQLTVEDEDGCVGMDTKEVNWTPEPAHSF